MCLPNFGQVSQGFVLLNITILHSVDKIHTLWRTKYRVAPKKFHTLTSHFVLKTRAGSLAALLLPYCHSASQSVWLAHCSICSCLTIYLSIFLSVCLSVGLSFYLSDILLTLWTTFVLITKLKSRFVFLSVCRSVCQSECLSACLNVFLTLCWHSEQLLFW